MTVNSDDQNHHKCSSLNNLVHEKSECKLKVQIENFLQH